MKICQINSRIRPWQPLLCHRGYKTARARAVAVGQLRRWGWNRFVFYRDVQAEFAMQFYHDPDLMAHVSIWR